VLETVKRLESWIEQRPQRALTVLWTMVLGYFTFWCAVSFVRHYYFHSSYDLAIMDQVVWNTSQGRLFGRSLEVSNDLADHVRPYLAVLSLAYLIVASPYVLLALQCLALAASALPLYRLASRHLKSPLIALASAFCLLGYPPIGLINRYDFHIEVLSIPLFIWAYERIDAGDLRTASMILALVLLCKENLGLTVAGCAIASGLLYKRWRFGLGWAVTGIAYSCVALLIVIPAFRGHPSDTLERYHWLGSTPVEMLLGAVWSPPLILQRLFTAQHALTVVQLIAPLGFAPLMGLPALIPAAPALIYNFLAEWPSQSTIYTHYMVPIVPFVPIAAVMGLRRLGASRRTGSRTDPPAGPANTNRHVVLAGIVMVAATLTSWVYENPVTASALFAVSKGVKTAPVRANDTGPMIWLNDAVIREGLRHVPECAGLLTTSHYAPHLSHRAWIEMIPRSPVSALPPQVEAIFLNLADQRWWSCEDYFETLRAAAHLDFGVTFEKGSVVLVESHKGDRTKLEHLLLYWPGCE
jgi:uncharacterized membrane protein